MRSIDCGLDVRPSNPQLFARVLVLALLPSLAGAQQPDSLPTDTLAPVVVTGVRLPTARELARGLAGRTATLHAVDLDARGGEPRAAARLGAGRARARGLRRQLRALRAQGARRGSPREVGLLRRDAL